MAKSEHKRQQKLLKKQRRTNDIKKARNKKLNVSNREVVLAAQRSPWLDCFVTGDAGMNVVYAIRQTRTGPSASVFLVDMYCLGIKDAFFIKDFDMDAFRERQSDSDGKKVSPAYALKLIEDAIAYARGIGFEPHGQLGICKLIFGDADATQCTEEFVFGKDGKPFYTAGPRDSLQRQSEILLTLEKLGEGNYHFISRESAELDDEDYYGDELDAEEFDDDDLIAQLDDVNDRESADEATVDAESVRNVE